MRRCCLTVLAAITGLVVQFSFPSFATAQRLASTSVFTPSAAHDTNLRPLAESAPRSLSFSTVTAAVEAEHRLLVSDGAEGKVSKKRLLPYYLAGAVVGGVVTFAAMPKSCDVGDNMFCQHMLFAYPAIGAGAGGAVGLLIGYLRERR